MPLDSPRSALSRRRASDGKTRLRTALGLSVSLRLPAIVTTRISLSFESLATGHGVRLKQLRRELWLRCVALRHLARQRRLECECLARRELWRRLMFHDSAHKARTVSQSVLRTAQTMMRYASQSGIRAAPDMVRPPRVKRAEPAAGFAAHLACSFGKILPGPQ
jgi:hypothetical protein